MQFFISCRILDEISFSDGSAVTEKECMIWVSDDGWCHLDGRSQLSTQLCQTSERFVLRGKECVCETTSLRSIEFCEESESCLFRISRVADHISANIQIPEGTIGVRRSKGSSHSNSCVVWSHFVPAEGITAGKTTHRNASLQLVWRCVHFRPQACILPNARSIKVYWREIVESNQKQTTKANRKPWWRKTPCLPIEHTPQFWGNPDAWSNNKRNHRCERVQCECVCWGSLRRKGMDFNTTTDIHAFPKRTTHSSCIPTNDTTRCSSWPIIPSLLLDHPKRLRCGEWRVVFPCRGRWHLPRLCKCGSAVHEYITADPIRPPDIASLLLPWLLARGLSSRCLSTQFVCLLQTMQSD